TTKPRWLQCSAATGWLRFAGSSDEEVVTSDKTATAKPSRERAAPKRPGAASARKKSRAIDAQPARDAHGHAAPDVAQAEAGPRALEIAIGAQVRTFRMKRGLGVSELAKLAGLSNGMLSKVESGRISPSLATLRSVAN